MVPDDMGERFHNYFLAFEFIANYSFVKWTYSGMFFITGCSILGGPCRASITKYTSQAV